MAILIRWIFKTKGVILHWIQNIFYLRNPRR
nr:MAG TPA: hypothetical protein [Caudoviricetes sp.]